MKPKLKDDESGPDLVKRLKDWQDTSKKWYADDKGLSIPEGREDVTKRLKESYAQEKGFGVSDAGEIYRERPIAHPVGAAPPEPPPKPPREKPMGAQDVVLEEEKGPPVAKMVERGPMGEMVDMLPKGVQTILGAGGNKGGPMGMIGNLAGAGGEGGMAGMAEVAGGPIALAMMAVQAVGKGIEGLGHAAEVAGHEMQALAGNDGMAALKVASKGVTDAFDAIPFGGGLVVSALKAATAATGAFGDTVNAFVHRGKELSQYSAQLTAANAIADVRQIGADIRESTRVGANIARATDASSRASVAFQNAIGPLKNLIAGKLATVMERLAVVMEGLVPAIEATANGLSGSIDGAWEGAKASLIMIWPAFREMLDNLDEINQAERNRHDLELALMARELIAGSFVIGHRAGRIAPRPMPPLGGPMGPPMFGMGG